MQANMIARETPAEKYSDRYSVFYGMSWSWSSLIQIVRSRKGTGMGQSNKLKLGRIYWLHASSRHKLPDRPNWDGYNNESLHRANCLPTARKDRLMTTTPSAQTERRRTYQTVESRKWRSKPIWLFWVLGFGLNATEIGLLLDDLFSWANASRASDWPARFFNYVR